MNVLFLAPPGSPPPPSALNRFVCFLLSFRTPPDLGAAATRGEPHRRVAAAHLSRSPSLSYPRLLLLAPGSVLPPPPPPAEAPRGGVIGSATPPRRHPHRVLMGPSVVLSVFRLGRVSEERASVASEASAWVRVSS